MSHRVRKFGTKKSKYEKFWIRTWKCLSVKLKLWTNAEVFISAPIKSSFPPAESAAGSSFCFCCSLIKKGLMRDLFTSYHSPSLAPPLPRSLCSPSLDVLRLSVMDGEQKRTSAALPVSRSVFAYMIVTATVCFQRLGRPLGFSSSPCSSSSGLSVRRFGLLRVRPVKLLHSHGPPVSRPASR